LRLRVFLGAVMADGATGGCPKCAVLASHVSRHAADGSSFQATLRAGDAGSRSKRQYQCEGENACFHLVCSGNGCRKPWIAKTLASSDILLNI
jgi:hypothetical protein